MADDSAREALARLEGHERLCTERWEQSRLSMMRIERGVSGLYKRWWQLAVGVIVILLGMVGSALWLGAQISKIIGGTWP